MYKAYVEDVNQVAPDCKDKSKSSIVLHYTTNVVS